MKKLMVLMLVLGMASLANASIILSVNGDPAPDQITLFPSDWITIDMHLTAGENITGYDVAFVLSNAQAAFDWSGITFPTVFDLPGAVVPVPTPQNVRVTASQIFSPAIPGPLVLVDELLLHCEEETDVVLNLVVMGTTRIDGGDIPVGTILDTITIHQVPEPATIALLGLGGLALLRRRK